MKIRNNTAYYRNLEADDRGMHLFYMIEEMEENLKLINAQLDTDNVPVYASRMNMLEHLSNEISILAERVNKDYVAEKTKNAISYAI
jgi:hypothetical protein